MSFTIYLYHNNSEKNTMDKSLVSAGSYTGTLKEASSIVDPVVLIESSSVITANYADIPQFNRKYFITDIICVRNNLYEIHMHVDVLSTYKTEIRSNSGIVARQEFFNNVYLDDPKLPIGRDTETSFMTMTSNSATFNVQSNIICINPGICNSVYNPFESSSNSQAGGSSGKK